MNELSFSTYIYAGPRQNIALRDRSLPQDRSIVFQDNLYPGKAYLFPDHHPIVKNWVAINLLTKAKEIVS
jgi:hypothetical protein